MQDREDEIRRCGVRDREFLPHHPNEKPTQRHYQGQVDQFAVYCRETGGVYLIPIGELPLDRAYLRVSAPRNGQRRGIRYAKDYEIARVECIAPDRA